MTDRIINGAKDKVFGFCYYKYTNKFSIKKENL